MNPYLMPVRKDGPDKISRQRRALEGVISEHMEGFGDALEGRSPKDAAKRVRAHTLLRVAVAAHEQARSVAYQFAARQNPLMAFDQAATEATLASSTLVASITAFVTQMIHTSLEVYPRLLSPNLVSVQPLTQPSGYVFFLKYVARNNGVGGTGQGRSLADLTQFDKTYSNLVNEGDQVKAVGTTLDKTLVEASYKALMHQYSLQADVAMRSQYGYDLSAIGDQVTADELAWEVDRDVIDSLVAFATTNPAGTLYFDPTAAGGYNALSPSEKREYDKGFITKTISQAKTDMAASVYQMPNWMLCGSNVIAMMSRSPEAYAVVTNQQGDQQIIRGSIIQTGMTPDGIKVWHDPQLDPDTAYLGFVEQGNPFYAGFIYAPFGLASTLTAAFQDPDTFLTKKSRALAYAKVGIRAKQFRRLKLGTTS